MKILSDKEKHFFENVEKSLNALANISKQQCWVILFKGRLIYGPNHRSFETRGHARRAFSHLITPNGTGMTRSEIRERLEKEGKLKFKNLSYEL